MSLKMIRKTLAATVAKEKDDLVIVCSTGAADTDGDIIDPKGWDLSAYEKGGQPMLWAHNSMLTVAASGGLPVGRAKSVKVEGTQLVIRGVEFAPHQFAQDVKAGVEAGTIKAVSVGFVPVPGKMASAPNGGIHFQEAKLKEVSFVPMGANEDALVQEGKALREECIKQFNSAEAGHHEPHSAAEEQHVMTLKEMLEKQVKEGLITQAQADAMLKAADAALVSATAPGLTPEQVAKMVSDAVAKAMAAVTKDASADIIGDATKGRVEGAPAVHIPRTRAKYMADMRKRRMDADPLKGKGLGISQVALAVAYARRNPGMLATEAAKEMGFSECADAMDNEASVKKDLGENAVSTGGAWVPESFQQDFIDLLTATAVVRSLVPAGSILQMRTDTVSIPRQLGDPTSYWLGEAQAATKSDVSAGLITLTARKMATECVVSRDLIRDAVVNADEIVRRSMVRSASLKEDYSLLLGAGTEYSPKGISNFIVSGQQTAATATSGLAFATAKSDLNTLISYLECANAMMDSLGFVMHPKHKAKLWSLATSLGTLPFEDEMKKGTLQGHPFRMTTQFPTPGATCPLIFGNWAEMIIGEKLAMELEEDTTYVSAGTTHSASARDQIVLRLWRKLDSNVRHAESFAKLTAVDWTP